MSEIQRTTRTVRRLTVPILVMACCLQFSPLAVQAEDTRTISPIDGVFSELPLEPSARHQIELALNSHDYARAEEALLQAEGQHPNAQLLSLLGSVFFLEHKYLNAAVALKKAEALKPLDEKDQFTLAMAYIAMGHTDWARPELEKLATIHPRNPLYLYWQGRMDYDRQDLLAAAAKFERVVALDSEFMKAYDNLGLCLEALGRYDEAIPQYQHAVLLNREHDINSAWPSLNLAALLVKLDRLEEAQPLLQESLRFDANFAQAHYQLGVLLEKRKEMPQAVEELTQSAVLDPANPQPHYALMRIYRRTGNMEQANRELEIFQTLKDKEPSPRLETTNRINAETDVRPGGGR